MENVLIVIYLLIVVAMIAVILLQRSEGGALGIGGGGNGGFANVRTSANLLTRTTAVLAVLFFATAIGLTILADVDRGSQSILDNAVQNTDGESPTSVLDALNSLQGDDAPAAPEAAPATPVDEDAPDLALPSSDAPQESSETSGN